MRTLIYAVAALCLIGTPSFLLYKSIQEKIRTTEKREWCNSQGGVYVNNQCFKAEIISYYGD